MGETHNANGRRTPPPWLVPAGLGMIVALLVALIVIVLTTGDGDDSESSDSSATPTSTSAPAPTEPAAVATTSVPTTVVATTAAPTTVAETTVATTTAPATTEPAAATPAAGTASVAVGGETLVLRDLVSCNNFWVGVDTTSHVLADDSGHLWVVDVRSFEEGGGRSMYATDMVSAVESAVYGRDTPTVSAGYVGEIDETQPGVARSTLTRQSGDGVDSIEIVLVEPPTVSDCSTGSISTPSPFPVGTQVEWRPGGDGVGQPFDLLASCGGYSLVTGGAILAPYYPTDGESMMVQLVNTVGLLGTDVNYLTPFEPRATDLSLEQTGDLLGAANVYPDGDGTASPSYLEWTERPLRSAVGEAGLLDDVCTTI